MAEMLPGLAEISRLENETERKLAIAALIDAAIAGLGFRAIVIGGVAVEFWTRGAYSTGDIDLYLPHGPAIDELLAPLGLVRDGRHWSNEEFGVYVEAPASFPAPSETVVEVELTTGQTALVLGVEDVLVYRLHEFVATGHRDVASQTLSLLSAPELDRARLGQRVREEGLEHALRAFDELAVRASDGDVFESYELHEIANALMRRS